jgi:DNA-binding beta-propeller fold protein YncE
MDPTVKFFYVANFNSNNISAYSIGSDGALTPVSGSPFSAGLGPISVAVNPMGKFAYVANIDSNHILAYGIDPNGALTPLPGSRFAARVKPSTVAITRLMHLARDETENATR